MLENQRRWQQLLTATMQLGEDDLRAALHSRFAEVRFTAAYVVGEKGLPWHRDLIPLVQDRTEGVRQSARRGLIILSYLALNPEVAERLRAQQRVPLASGNTPAAGPAEAGGDEGARRMRPPPATPPAAAAPAEAAAPAKLTPPVDFGPKPWAFVPARVESRKRWTKWWDDRESPGPGTTSIRTEAADPEVQESELLARTLVRAVRDTRWDVLERFRDAKGVQYTEALASAAARLSGAAQDRVRETLAARMRRMTDGTLLRYLGDEDLEIRRAAPLGLARRGSISCADKVIELLMDREPAVARAAHEALVGLSKEDFGPPAGASDAQRLAAVARWRSWWQKK
jgi:hypothetical protein